MRYFITRTLLIFAAIFLSTVFVQNSFATTSANDVKNILQDLQFTDAIRYDTKDDTNRNVETLDVVANPSASPYDSDRYIGVSHVLENGAFQVYLTKSDDLINWTNLGKLKSNASNPAITTTSNGGYLVALESHDAPGNHIQMRYYQSLSHLKAHNADDVFDGDRSLSQHAEGTPGFRSVDWNTNFEDSTIHLGMHYYKNGDVDRQALGTLQNGVWTEEIRGGMNNLLDGLLGNITSSLTNNTLGNFGSRRDFSVDGKKYELIEGQLTKNDWASWRLFLYDVDDNNLMPLDMDPHYGQTSFGNGAAHVLPAPDGNGEVLFWTAFLFSDGAPNGAGQMVTYKYLP